MTPAQKSEFELALGMVIIDDVGSPTPFASINGLTAQEIVAKGAAKIAAVKAKNAPAE